MIGPDGKVTLPYNWEDDRKNGIKVRSDRMDEQFKALVEAIDAQLDAYGVKSVKGNINMAGHKLQNLAVGTENTDAVNKSQLDSKFNSIPSATETTKGLVELSSVDEAALGVDNTRAVTPFALKKIVDNAIVQSAFQLPLNYLAGMDLTLSSNNKEKEFTVLAGQARDSSNTTDIIIKEAISKRIDTIWQAGSGNGGVPSNITISAGNRYKIFAIATAPKDATSGSFVTIDLTGNLSNIQAVTRGFLRVVVDGINKDLVNINFTGMNTFDRIVNYLQSMITGCTITNNNGVLTFTSTSKGATSSINLSTIPGGIGTDLSLEGYFDAVEGTIKGGTNFVSSIVDVGIDTDANATNLLATATEYTYYRKIGDLTTDSSNNLQYLQNDIWQNYKPGESIYWDGGIIPDRFLVRNGATISRISYASLFAAIGTIWGAGDGLTTFQLPNDIDRFAEGKATAGGYTEAGLPNIIGSLGETNNAIMGGDFPNQDLGSVGCLTQITSRKNIGGYDWGNGYASSYSILFNAARSSTIYGKSNTVQPNSSGKIPLIRY